MKLSFSTVGCPNWSWADIVASAADLGYAGIEVRGVGDDLFRPDARVFQPDSAPKTRAELARHNLQISCLASDVLMHDPEQDCAATLGRYLALARGLGAPGIRVLGDTWGEPGAGVDAALVERRLRELAPLAREAGVELWVETNGVWADTARLLALLEAVDSPAVGVVWDIHHPYRYFGETPAQTAANIGRYARHVHVKDSVMGADGKTAYKMFGYGDLPAADCLRELKALGYDGFLSMEWVKRWNHGLEDAGVVLPHFAYQARRVLAAL